MSVKVTTNNNEGAANPVKRRGSAGAIRTSRWRLRRQRGFRVYQIEVCDADIKALMARGLLDRQNRDDPNAVEQAIGLLLDRL